jgi:hypothetical protein
MSTCCTFISLIISIQFSLIVRAPLTKKFILNKNFVSDFLNSAFMFW